MIRLAKLTDYGFVVLTRFALPGAVKLQNARDLATETGLPLPTVSKLLKMLARSGLLLAHRGSKGGYVLSREPEKITVAEIIHVLEGSFAMTDCIADSDCGCMVGEGCQVRGHWELINKTVYEALSKMSLADMAIPPGKAVAANGKASENQRTLERAERSSKTPCRDGCGAGSEPCSCGETIHFLSGDKL